MKQLLKVIFWTAIVAGTFAPVLSMGLKQINNPVQGLFYYMCGIIFIAKIGEIIANKGGSK